MYIERNGIKIELTYEELAQAHAEFEKEGMKADIVTSFAQNYLDVSDLYDFDDFVDGLFVADGVSNQKWKDEWQDVYDELCENFGKEVVNWLANSPEEFFDAVHKVYDKNYDSNESYNDQIEWAIKTALCDKSFQVKLGTVKTLMIDDGLFFDEVGFLFNGCWVTNPFLDVSSRFEVDPVAHYGERNVYNFVNGFLEVLRNKEIYKQAYVDFYKLADVVEGFEGSFEELCVKLGGQNYDEELFDVNFGVIAATVYDVDGAYEVSTISIDVWNDSMNGMIEECISFKKLKNICAKLDVDVDSLVEKVSVEGVFAIQIDNEQMALNEALLILGKNGVTDVDITVEAVKEAAKFPDDWFEDYNFKLKFSGNIRRANLEDLKAYVEIEEVSLVEKTKGSFEDVLESAKERSKEVSCDMSAKTEIEKE